MVGAKAMIIAEDALAVLGRSVAEGNLLRLPPGQLDRPLYERVDKALRAAGGKWTRRLKAHVFEVESEPLLLTMLDTGEVVDQAKEYGFFETPSAIALQVMDAAEISRPYETHVLEPSAGRGGIAGPFAVEGCLVDCVELQPVNCAVLADQDLYRVVMVGDFLRLEPPAAPPMLPAYDIIAMNPPFGGQADIRHVLHALRFLRPGGRLVAIMAAGVKFRDNALTREFRAEVKARRGSIEDLPAGAFKVSGTMVNTVLVTMEG